MFYRIHGLGVKPFIFAKRAVHFRRFWVKEPCLSENETAEKCYRPLSRSTYPGVTPVFQKTKWLKSATDLCLVARTPG